MFPIVFIDNASDCAKFDHAVATTRPIIQIPDRKRIEKRTGSIRPGLEADFVAVERDPLSDVKNLQDILLVINNGKVVVNRLDW